MQQDTHYENHILTVNAGSSSLKFALFTTDKSLTKSLEGELTNIGQGSSQLSITDLTNHQQQTHQVDTPNHSSAIKILLHWLEESMPSMHIEAVGHRIVHGGPKYSSAVTITPGVIEELRKLTVFDPEHLPIALQLINVFEQLLPNKSQIACFDTAFHHNLPWEAATFAIPRKYQALGLRRYGFHGLSYAYVLQELERTAGQDSANGRLILAHLGSGVSLAAVQQRQSIDTTMGLTPASGVPMSTRSGDLDPGIASYLLRTEGLNIDTYDAVVNFQSGLLGLSETTSDMKQLLEQEQVDRRAAEAVSLFCYQIKKTIGSFAAALGGLDTLIFTGGMGESAPKIRTRICDGLEFLGIRLNPQRNNSNEPVISEDTSPLSVRIIHTDEASIIAHDVQQLMNTSNGGV